MLSVFYCHGKFYKESISELLINAGTLSPFCLFIDGNNRLYEVKLTLFVIPPLNMSDNSITDNSKSNGYKELKKAKKYKRASGIKGFRVLYFSFSCQDET